MQEIASAAGVSLSTVKRWRCEPDFPRGLLELIPRSDGSSRIGWHFNKAEVQEWVRKRKKKVLLSFLD